MMGSSELVSSLEVIERIPSTISDQATNVQLKTLIHSYSHSTDRLDERSVFFSKLMSQLFPNSKSSSVCYDLLLFATKEAPADVWLELLVLKLQSELDPTQTRLCLRLLSNYLLDYKRLPQLYSSFIEAASCVSDKSRFSYLIERARPLLNLPTHVSNATKLISNFSRLFLPEVYYPYLLKHSAEIRYMFLNAILISQSCFLGFGKEVWNFILPRLYHSQETSDIWSSALLLIPEKMLETTIVPLLNQATHPHLVALCLAPAFKTQMQDQLFRLFHRLLLFRVFPKPYVPVNIFGVLRECETDDLASRTERDLGMRLLQTWSDAKALQRTRSKQRIYLNQALVSWVRSFQERLALSPSYSTMVSHVMTGITAHLACNIEEQKVLGMAVGEWLVKQFQIGGKPAEGEALELRFNFQENETVKLLRPLFEPNLPFNPPECLNNDDLEALFVVPQGVKLNTVNKSADLDSDDDPDEEFKSLPDYATPAPSGWPYHARRPRYLRECLDGLAGARNDSDEAASNEIALSCFAHAKELIYHHRGGAVDEIAVSFADALLHTEPPACPHTEEVNLSRHQALVALAVVSPKRTSRYLTGQFTQPGLAVNQRHAIISALTDATCTLASDFSPVAGSFFFPMLRAAEKLFGQECDVYAHLDWALLARLVAALGTMYACARHSPKLPRMADGLLALGSYLLTTAQDPAVRRSSLSALGVVLTVTPMAVLAANQRLLLENNLIEKLSMVSQDDTHSECQSLAGAALSSLRDNLVELSGNDLKTLSLAS